MALDLWGVQKHQYCICFHFPPSFCQVKLFYYLHFLNLKCSLDKKKTVNKIKYQTFFEFRVHLFRITSLFRVVHAHFFFFVFFKYHSLNGVSDTLTLKRLFHSALQNFLPSYRPHSASLEADTFLILAEDIHKFSDKPGLTVLPQTLKQFMDLQIFNLSPIV